MLIKGAVLHSQGKAAAVPPPHCALKAALPASPWEGALTRLERAVNHAEIWHTRGATLCLLNTEPLPKSATGAVLPPLCALRAARAPSFPSWVADAPPACSSSLWGSEGWAPPAAAALPQVAAGKRGLASAQEHTGVRRDGPPIPAHCSAAPHTASGAWAPLCTHTSVANPTVHSEDRSLGKVVAALSGREPGIHTYTPPEG